MLERVERLPTPAQYGLLLQLCAASGISNVYDAALYLWRTRGRSRTAIPSLVRSLAILTSVLIISHAIG